MREIKLSGKLDLSMWRGTEDEDDKDSSIDLSPSPSPLPASPSSNNNRINGNLAVLAPQQPTEKDTFVLESANVPRESGTEVPKANESDLQLHLSLSHHEEQHSDNAKGFEESGTIEQSRGGVKKVEFVEQLGKFSMGPDDQTGETKSKEKATKGKQTLVEAIASVSLVVIFNVY